MKIDRHNYEEYFLLYVDNELTVDQKKEVELFVKENADLEEELVMLQQSRLIPDKIVFEEKHLLVKEENNSFINLSNYEEWLVLYVDNELNNEEKIAVEKFAAAHPHVQQELALFHQTKLQPEKIVFADKEDLYRKEGTRVISMQWWRVAVAAMLIIAVGITTYSVLNKKNTTGLVITKDEVAKKQAPNPVKTIEPSQPTQSSSVVDDRKQSKDTALSLVVKTDGKGQLENKHKATSVQSNNEQQLIVGIPKLRPDIITDAITIQTTQSNPNGAKLKKKINTPKIPEPTVTKDSTKTPEPMYARNTENKRLRGFFRKATRIIEHTTNINPADDDNRVLIGGMAINLK